MSLTFDEASRLYASISNTSQTELLQDLLRYAVDYARIRTDWYFLSDEERTLRDRSRTAAHNAFIDSCNILSRAMHRAGEDNTWRVDLGMDRKQIGDFACYLHSLLGLSAR